MSIERNKVYHQVYRVGDSSLERWELYVGEDQMPDFDGSGQPVATSTSLPFNYTPDPADSGQTKVLYCVVRKRNQFNLLSHNQYPTLIEIDDLGDEELGPITSPEIIEVTDGDAGEIFVHARYPRDVDRNEADTWDVYVEDGVDPDPDIHTPKATVSMGKPGVDYMLKQSVTGLTPGDTVHVMVVARRASESGSG
ncbi:MAG: hypothetical protein GWN12_10020, partial [Thermoplasmata archaeon]|nr:hypothetical protein [Thermoplasmata archaeon]NIS12368.1 hypothetical protein [Thermoplasmata archaeon]NIS20290.1 hypothetical protein [Thermoplasmata archaeon]NIT77634.1 hypothetical protein [Thermoplasmata archaeon]NIW89096.1 hypothetical protein [Thermoplasmata archaeon]